MLKLKGDVKHERSTRGAAPTFDAATCEGRRCPCKGLRCHASSRVMPRGFFFFSQLASTRTDSGRFTLNQADSGRNGRFKQKFKKNKKVQNGLFELNIKPYFSSLHTNTPNFSSLTLSLSITRLSLSLCSLPLSLLAVKHSTSAESVT